MAATGLSADPTEYRSPPREQSDEQIDLWAQEMMRDVAKRRGVIRVLEDLRRAATPQRTRYRTGVRFRRWAAGRGRARRAGPPDDAGDHALRPRAGHPRRSPRRSPAPDRLPRRELRRARLRLTGPSPGSRGSSGSSIPSRRSSTASSSPRSPSSPEPTRHSARARGVDDRAPGVDRGAQRPPRRARRRGPQAGQADPGRSGERARRRASCSWERPSGSGWRPLAGDPGSRCWRVVVLAIGYGYDLVAKGTAWSWLPFAVGIPILPVYGWLGAAGRCRRSSSPCADGGGGRRGAGHRERPADLERDRQAGVSVATRLGLEGSWRLHAACGGSSGRGPGLAGVPWLGLVGALPVVAAAGLIAAVVWSRPAWAGGPGS